MTTIVITSLLVQAVVGIYLFNLNSNQKSPFELVLKAILITLLTHLSVKFLWIVVLENEILYSKIASGFGLLYGPLFLIAYRTLQEKILVRKQLLLHLIPFFIATVIYIVMVAGILFKNISIEIVEGYNKVYQLLVQASLIIYLLFVFIKTRSLRNVDAGYNVVFKGATLLLSALLLGLVGMLFPMDKWMDTRMIFYIPLTILPVMIIRYKLLQKQIISLIKEEMGPAIAIKEEHIDEENLLKERYAKSGLDEAILLGYEQKLNQYVTSSKVYLNPDLSLEMLAQGIDIPKHHLTQLLNEILQKNFYQYINAFRIEHAINLLQTSSDENINLLSLAYDCGFNSKSSFNNYFKKITGETPSSFKKKLHEQIHNQGILPLNIGVMMT